jgi:glucuronate isomerase
VNAGYLAELVAEHRLTEDDATELAADLAYRLAQTTFTRQSP